MFGKPRKLKHKYINLNIGLVKENYVIAKREEMDIWKERGFERIRKYPIFLYKPNRAEVIMLGKPLTIRQFGLESLINSKIIDMCPCLGTYGMGGPGFVGFKVEGNFGIRWLVYCIWSASEHILLDDKILDCHPKFEAIYDT